MIIELEQVSMIPLSNDVIQIVYKYIHRVYLDKCFVEFFKKLQTHHIMEFFDETCDICIKRNNGMSLHPWSEYYQQPYSHRCREIFRFDRQYSIINGELYMDSGEPPYNINMVKFIKESPTEYHLKEKKPFQRMVDQIFLIY